MHRKAAITGLGQPLAIVTSPLEKPPAGEIRVKTAFAGICHTDITINDKDMNDVRGRYGEDRFRGMVLGHEISGYVDEVGEDVNLDAVNLKLGDPVMVCHARGCQKCSACKTGKPNFCPDPHNLCYSVGTGPFRPGGYQTHVNLPPAFLKKVPNGMAMETAAMMSCSVGTAYAAVLKLRSAIEFGVETDGKARVMIIGCGGLGQWALKFIKLVFPHHNFSVIAVDVVESKLTAAKKYGADDCILWDAEKSQEDNVSLVTKSGLVHGILDFCVTPMTLKSSLSCIPKSGHLVLVGLANTTLPIDFQDIVLRSITIWGVLNYTDKELSDLAKLVAENQITTDNLEFVTLDDVNDIFAKLKKGQIKGRALIRF